ncbi:hypothetical protein [Paenibacillus sp. Z6-24]
MHSYGERLCELGRYLAQMAPSNTKSGTARRCLVSDAAMMR